MSSAIDSILAFEAGMLSQQEVLVMFQSLLNSGDIWKLGPNYIDNAAYLLSIGVLRYEPKEVN